MCNFPTGALCVEREGYTDNFFDINVDGRSLSLVKSIRRDNAGRNLERLAWELLDDVMYAPYLCNGCGLQLRSWEGVLDHFDMCQCHTCGAATPKWEGWDYQCPAYDRKWPRKVGLFPDR